MKGIWYLVRVENEKDIGIVEIERWKVVDSNTTSVNIGGDFNYQSMNIKCDKAVPASPITKELPATPKRPDISTTQSSETENSQTAGREIRSSSIADVLMVKITNLENRILSVEKATLDKLYDEVQISQNNQMLKVLYQTQPEANKWFKEEISKVKQEMESRTEQLSDDLKELKDAFEAECDHYDSDIKYLRQQLSELQQAFVIKGLCKPNIEAGQFVVKNKDGSIRPCAPSDGPSGIIVRTDNDNAIRIASHYTLNGMNSEIEELDPPAEHGIVEQIKAGEKKLVDISNMEIDCVAAICNKSNAWNQQSPHLKSLVSKHLGIKINGVNITDEGKAVYTNEEKGIRIEFT